MIRTIIQTRWDDAMLCALLLGTMVCIEGETTTLTTTQTTTPAIRTFAPTAMADGSTTLTTTASTTATEVLPSHPPTSSPAVIPVATMRTTTLTPSSDPSVPPSTASPVLVTTLAPTTRSPTELSTTLTTTQTTTPGPPTARPSYETTTLTTTITTTATEFPPSFNPTLSPTTSPSITPTDSPSKIPTIGPTNYPSISPSRARTAFPTVSPSYFPSSFPTSMPSNTPSLTPSNSPSSSPSSDPTQTPSGMPSLLPSYAPTVLPSVVPSSFPSYSPSSVPTPKPSAIPTTTPTVSPTHGPTTSPTQIPTPTPSTMPSAGPTGTTTVSPSSSPTFLPTTLPSLSPTHCNSQRDIFPSDDCAQLLDLCDSDSIVQAYCEWTCNGCSLAPTSLPTSNAPSYSPTNQPTYSEPTLAPTTPAPTTISPTFAPTRFCSDYRAHNRSGNCRVLCEGGTDNCSCCACANGKCLDIDGGRCVECDSCPQGCTPRGSGNHNRICDCSSTTCPCDRRTDKRCNCQSCNDTICEQCANGHYLYEGECVAECPAYFTEPVGTGRFNRYCRPIPRETTLFPGQCLDQSENIESDCLECNVFRTSCARCGNSKYLVDGRCEDCCPTPMCAFGDGQNNKFCDLPSIDEPQCYGNCPSAPTNCDRGEHCYECQLDTVCQFSPAVFNATIVWMLDQSGSISSNELDTVRRTMHRTAAALFNEEAYRVADIVPECLASGVSQVHLRMHVSSFDDNLYSHVTDPSSSQDSQYVSSYDEYQQTLWYNATANPLTANAALAPQGVIPLTSAALNQLASVLNIEDDDTGSHQLYKTIVLVVDGISLEPCGQVNLRGSDNCVVAAAKRFHRAGFDVHLVATMFNGALQEEEDIFRHFKEVSYPPDEGEWDPRSRAYSVDSDETRRRLHKTYSLDSLVEFGAVFIPQFRASVVNRSEAVTVADPSGTIDRTCGQCYNRRFLFEGRCLDECPTLPLAEHECLSGLPCTNAPISGFPAYVGTGASAIGRTCVAEKACGISNCFRCIKSGENGYADAIASFSIDLFSSTGSPVCTVCRNGYYLLHGRCVQDCPVSYQSRGSGRFHKKCISPCSSTRFCRMNRCSTYLVENSNVSQFRLQLDSCDSCSQGTYLDLIHGECIESCDGQVVVRPEVDGTSTLVCSL